ncbi:MAG: ABC transporter permease [Oligoflexia bacterium]|nr:ABC transporter permease [Oligoflexia bacterium]
MKELLLSTAEQIVALGAKSISLIAVSGVAAGAVMTIQFGAGLQRFGGRLYVPEIVAFTILREIAPILCSLLLAGRVGSGITAEIASMNVTEQIDAVRALGTSPVGSLVVPRVLACVVIFPALTLFTDYISMASAMLVAYMTDLAIEPHLFLSKTLAHIRASDLWSGVLKTVVFGLYIGVASCWRGLTTTGGTRGVGTSTTWIVVHASIFILIADFFLSKLLIVWVYGRV